MSVRFDYNYVESTRSSLSPSTAPTVHRIAGQLCLASNSRGPADWTWRTGLPMGPQFPISIRSGDIRDEGPENVARSAAIDRQPLLQVRPCIGPTSSVRLGFESCGTAPGPSRQVAAGATRRVLTNARPNVLDEVRPDSPRYRLTFSKVHTMS